MRSWEREGGSFQLVQFNESEFCTTGSKNVLFFVSLCCTWETHVDVGQPIGNRIRFLQRVANKNDNTNQDG